MRRTQGISFQDFKDKFHLDYFDYIGQGKEQILNYQNQGLLIVEIEGMRFTESGINLSNRILADIM